MAVAQGNNFTTGSTNLPEITNDFGVLVGELNYNGCSFSPLFATELSGRAVKDEANRTVKLMEYTLTADGYVTRADNVDDVEPNMLQLRKLLTQQGGALIYEGRGMNLVVNVPGSPVRDVAWGPKPELLEFQPLGAGRSAKVRWQVKVCLVETEKQLKFVINNAQEQVDYGVPLLQFNYETNVTYGEDGYSSLSVRGTLEIGLTRFPDQKTRTLTRTADSVRAILDQRIMAGVNLAQFYPVRRNFSLSRDKRTLEWDFQFEERAYQQYPPDCTLADGSYSVRPAKSGMGLCQWLCSLHTTYTVRADRPRRTAWLAFLALLRLRMEQSENQPPIPGLQGGNQNPQRANVVPPQVAGAPNNPDALKVMEEQAKKQKTKARRAWLIDFSVDEGLYKSSKTTTFTATWRMICTFSHVLLASGIWTKVDEDRDPKLVGPTPFKGNYWKSSMQDASGPFSWKKNFVDPKLDVIVDFGQ